MQTRMAVKRGHRRLTAAPSPRRCALAIHARAPVRGLRLAHGRRLARGRGLAARGGFPDGVHLWRGGLPGCGDAGRGGFLALYRPGERPRCGGLATPAEAAHMAAQLRQAAAAEREAGQLFLRQAETKQPVAAGGVFGTCQPMAPKIAAVRLRRPGRMAGR